MSEDNSNSIAPFHHLIRDVRNAMAKAMQLRTSENRASRTFDSLDDTFQLLKSNPTMGDAGDAWVSIARLWEDQREASGLIAYIADYLDCCCADDSLACSRNESEWADGLVTILHKLEPARADRVTSKPEIPSPTDESVLSILSDRNQPFADRLDAALYCVSKPGFVREHWDDLTRILKSEKDEVIIRVVSQALER